jgi:hypothetical protein
MVTISCSCGSTATRRPNPLRGLPVEERLALVADAFAAHGGFLTLEVDASWHPGSDEPGTGCVVLADLDEIDAAEGLTDDDARRLRAVLGAARVTGRPLPLPVELDGLTFRATPAAEFRPVVTYVAYDRDGTALEAVAELSERDLLGELVELYRDHGRPALTRVDRAAPRVGLAAAIDAARSGAAHSAA